MTVDEILTFAWPSKVAVRIGLFDQSCEGNFKVMSIISPENCYEAVERHGAAKGTKIYRMYASGGTLIIEVIPDNE